MTRILLTVVTVLLALLWSYAALSKILDFRRFKQDLKKQALPSGLIRLMVWLLPLSEAGAVLLLLFPDTRLGGMVCSLLMMLVFTGYIAGAVGDIYARYPCPCSGLFRNLSWSAHLKVNIVFTLISLAGTALEIMG